MSAFTQIFGCSYIEERGHTQLKKQKEGKSIYYVQGMQSPLMADHMAREECYYLQKLAETTGEVKAPACDPTKPRTQ
ncbi:DUF2935 domain-containing protein [Geobacillus stearothermophilus]|nr:DUF2935 domain-containing protein [Geobacillus stearothermophilus]MED3740372.1 DUF2935 domain-containing protein [Geobacillus stearothermophilus]MED3767678.1 DUF2935 domain-containing protein [Geobacillus stearothermophilus]MED4870372.1 DUF2935 domain-containing protein [Geobacillus stearothermophilus]MED5013814.1 DUF2935 domain-containing protein [Geobacillus stearothermophilus]